MSGFERFAAAVAKYADNDELAMQRIEREHDLAQTRRDEEAKHVARAALESENRGGGYEDAPATKMLATSCACCSRPLVDAVSVEAGIGPVCRERHGYGEAQGAPDWVAVRVLLACTPPGYVALAWEGDEDGAHKAANVLVHRIAVEHDGAEVIRMTNALRHLGYAKLAGVIAERLAPISIELEGDRYAVKTPYAPEVVEAMRRVPGRRYDRERKLNTFPTSSRTELWRTLSTLFAGRNARGPKGLFTIGGV